MWVSLRICTVNIILSVWFFTDMLYLCLSLYFPPTQSVSSEDSPWWLLNRDDKQLKKHILIGCGNDKTLTKHERFMYSEEKPRLPLNKRYFLLSSKTCIELDTLFCWSMCHSTAQLHLYSKVATLQKNTQLSRVCAASGTPHENPVFAHTLLWKVVLSSKLLLRDYSWYTTMAYSISWWLDSKYKHEPEEGKSEEKEDTWRPLGSLMDFYTEAANWQNRYFHLRFQGVIFFCRKRWYNNTGRQKPLYPYCRGAFWNA